MARFRNRGELFFVVGVRAFFAAALVSAPIAMLGAVVQMRVLGAVAFACSLLGILVSATGMRLTNPIAWRARTARIAWAIGMRDYPPYIAPERSLETRRA